MARGLVEAQLLERVLNLSHIELGTAVVFISEVLGITAPVVAKLALLESGALKVANCLEVLISAIGKESNVSQLLDLAARASDVLVDALHAHELVEAETLRALEVAKR